MGGWYIGDDQDVCVVFFFFKQKTAYEIGTGDWSSDVCSSDLVVERISEDERGLRVIARIDRTQSRAAHMLKNGEVSGLSFGYRARDARRSTSGRELLGIDLFEVSLVTHPLQHNARIHMVA